MRNRRFANWLRAARRAARLTQEDLAEKMEVSQSAIHLWEKDGLMAMTPAELRRLAAALGVTAIEAAAAFGYPVTTVISHHSASDGPLTDLEPPELAARIAAMANRLQELTTQQRGDDSAASDKAPDTAA